ncbi:alcohol dehydrogenase zinc-binding domain protein [Aspergillus japonicus CBS 114.51]|uniref:Alcohol dehydrogenase zinc-binding domain protein n=2 Tax=Aspergillus TaxID=5052 RepID=A0A2V5H3P9_ASPV1|nr:alcohol dehydrogenase zinc-binding domain protein [Aspergillus japonicus CBS 114.51]PYI18201.1 alcohol dehydrogenase zinc-binding domain protein [Aspergillus violaceofuscus CBS 115571]RAH81384.1 alcohol dehydrogenase zinc-binding domain protein [Aspergillus japonicus CBS 114.51]
MKAIIIEQFGGPDTLVIKEIPRPEPQTGEVVIKVRAFGVNHAEMHMRKGQWAEWMPVSGIECVGTVVDCPGGEFAEGTAVASLMGGLGRTINGSYAEYTRVRASNVVELGPGASTLGWQQLAAIPESYATAWTCLFRNLDLRSGQTLLIRGATSAFGQAALNLAAEKGARVVATSRRESRFAHLKALGAERAEVEGPNLSERLAERFDAVLDLVGNSTIVDSLKMARRDGRVCLAGFLGGLAPIQDFNPLLQMASGVHFSFFGSFVFGTPEFPLSDVPLQSIVEMVADRKFTAEPSRVFRFDEIREAHRVMEANEANGKMVVVVDE